MRALSVALAACGAVLTVTLSPPLAAVAAEASRLIVSPVLTQISEQCDRN